MKAWIEGAGVRTGAGQLVALDLEQLRGLREQYGRALEPSPELLSWARSAYQDPAPTETALSRHAPALAAAMPGRPYQLTGAARIAAQRAVGILDEPGLGKTAMSLAGLLEAGEWDGRHLVICPKTAVLSTWREQIEHWTDGQVFTALDSAKAKRQAVEDFMAADTGPRFLVTNPESLRTTVEQYCTKCQRWADAVPKVVAAEHVGRNHKTPWTVYNQPVPELFGIEFDSIIADEAHDYMLGLRGQSGKLTLVNEGLKRIQGRRRIPMTGTPFRGREWNIFGLLNWMDPARFSSFWKFIGQYFIQEQTDHGHTEIIGLNPDRADQFGELLDEMFLRRTRAEVRADLPDNLHHVHWVELEGEHAKQYRAMETDGFTRVDTGLVHGNGVLSELGRLQQMAFGAFDWRGDRLTPKTSPKFDLLVDMLAERGVRRTGQSFGHMKFVVASQYTHQLEWMADRLTTMRIPTLQITGAVTGARREAVRGRFQAPYHQSTNPHRVLMLNIGAGGMSITLDAWCDEMFILDESFIEDDLVQVRGRIDNRGDRVAVRVFHYLRTRDTIDERIANDNLAQAAMQNQLLDGRRGVEIAKRLMGRR